MKLAGSLVPVAEVSASQRSAMFALMERYYAHVAEATFLADLREKDWVIMLRDPATDALCGFSTQMLLDVAVADAPRRILFSGDTIIDEHYRGDVALSHVWGNLVLSLIDRFPGRELYWFLICKGYKTYRFLPVFFHAFYPRVDVPTPAELQAILNACGRAKFGVAYDAVNGLVRGGFDKDRLRPGVADLTAERLRDPHIRFFAERNPRHSVGEELCCLAPLTRENFTPAAYRVIHAVPRAGIGKSGVGP